MSGRCETCRHRAGSPYREHGRVFDRCRRFPPQGDTGFARILVEHDSCGEYAAQPAAPEKPARRRRAPARKASEKAEG